MADVSPGYRELTISTLPGSPRTAYAWSCERCACLIAPGETFAELHDQAVHSSWSEAYGAARCDQGHYYVAGRFDACPLCASGTLTRPR